jgi:lysozyme
VYLIVSNSVHTKSSPQAGGTVSTSQSNHSGSQTGGSATTTTQTTTSGDSGATFYVVRAGDTLSEIALRTHVSVATIERLNPHVAANAMQVGQRLRLRR